MSTEGVSVGADEAPISLAEAAAAAGCPVHLGNEFGNAPYPVYKEVQEAGPVRPVILRDGSEAYIITRYDDVRACYADPRLSSSLDDAPKPKGAGSLAAPPVGGLVLRRDEASGHMMINQDPPDHTRLRKLVVPSFAAKRVNAMEPHILRIADELLGPLAGEDRVELIERYAKPLPVMVQSQLLGVSPDKHEAFTRGMDELTGGKDVEAAQGGLDLIKELLAEQIAHKRLHPAEDLLTTLVQVAEEEGRMEEIELLASAIQVMLAGYFGIQSMIGNCVYWLLKYPEMKEKLLADPSLMPAAMDEIFRFDGPQQPGSNRYATEDIEVGGGVIPKGSLVILSVSAANRDPKRFPNPDVLDFERENAADHIAFGSGIHFCVGSRLALKVVGLATLSLLQEFPHMRLAIPEEELNWELRTPFRGLDSLPVFLR
ncbi:MULTISPECIES: cytochrome P450 [unclassified Streptomyces]|uniref:cytochrome P450 n=1 Tax=unclassified Streptomyces TaxID=2593676 RepID=UPI00224E643E|nr:MULTISPECIES: cytochrome P450 [unclassified Streptomyces]WSP53037.1 cytochrome P450 [Streptomyces sp. NBC_01241]WSU19634.1 cytochrome P450 [Streptomyces sp. NBC_01108]MCX4800046.1 cytochrome P450 [Streptomyces sp. NBC_01242]WSJ40765.1 cytochrome P450 [Streptomyces sp. NBC_01321]WSP59814.1 cytochrome P450 [Streptomyces sp. NBC_01241]